MSIRYTIRNIPPAVDQVIRKRSRQSGKSFNQTVVDVLTDQTFGGDGIPHEEKFDWLFGAGNSLLDESFDEAIKLQSMPDKRLWQ